MKLVIGLLAMLLCACAGSDVLSQVGKALHRVSEAYVAADRVQTQVEHLAELVCAEPPPAAANVCEDVRESLGVAGKANDVAQRALVAAHAAFEALDDADAGAP